MKGERIGVLSIVVILTAMLIVPGIALAGKVKFTFATTNSPKDFSSQAVMRWQKAMKKASNGDLDMTFIPGGALGGDKQLLQQLSSNEIQLHVAGPVVVHHLVREYQCMEAEFVYTDEDHGFRVWTGPLGKEVSKKLEGQYNITIVGVGSRGSRNVTSNVPVRKPEDLKGVKIRITNPLRQEIFKAFGALPAPLSIKEVYGALRQGVFEAQENPISTIWGHKFHEVQKYINLTGHVWSYWVISANKGFIDSLGSEHRKIFMDTLNDAVAWLNKTVPAESKNLLKKMEKEGVTVIKPDVAAFQKIAAPIVQKFASEKCRPGLLDDIAKYK
jgi:tripartite ATP-independent transporter DctP family solute receptor